MDDDAAPQLSASDETVSEGNTATLTVSLDGISDVDVVVNYSTGDSTADSGDYTGVQG